MNRPTFAFHRRMFALLVVVLLAAALLPLGALFAQEGRMPTGGQPWDLKNVAQAGQFSFFDTPAGASTTGKPLDIGDFDGNGCGDIAITGQNASPSWLGSAGHLRIVMNRCPIGGVMNMETVPPGQGVFSIYGGYAGDMAGTETYIADFNNDGYDDLLFSAQNSDGPYQDRTNAGAAYLLFGGPDFASHPDIVLNQLPADVLVFYGATAEDRFGLWVEGGDFDGDGFHDLLIGANQADGEGDHRINAGEAWIIYGDADMVGKYGQVTDMAEPPADATWIIGGDYDDLMGSCVWGDDLDGDGFDDAIVSAGLWRASSGVGGLSFGGADGPANRRYNSGETFVIFGRPDMRTRVFDLAALVDDFGVPTDPGITVIYGQDPNDLLGEEIAVGDMNGDGRNDLVLGTLIGDGPENNMDEAGEAWVIYTFDPFRGIMIDTANPQPGRTVVIYPDQPDSKAGDTLRVADIDGDGVEDLLYGAPDYDPTGYDLRVRPNAGMMAVIFGEQGGLPNENGIIRLFDPPAGLRVRFFIGADDNDMMPYALAVADIDGDGHIDIAPNAMGGDGAANDRINAGEIYVISGAEFLAPDHDYGATAAAPAAGATTPALAGATSTPLPQTPVGITQGRDIGRGRQHFEETCAGCHGFQGEGVAGLGLPLVTSPLVLYMPDADLLAFLRAGRPADHPDNTTNVAMPPSGGRPDWSDGDLLDVIAYLRWLARQ